MKKGDKSSKKSLSPSVRHMLTDEEVDQALEAFTQQDAISGVMTWSRIIVEKFLMKHRWYFPKRSGENAPSLSKAWAFYEHITLPRCFVGDGETDHVLRRAEPGEQEVKTELYSPFFTPRSALNEWGVGVGLYFTTVRLLAIILLATALLNIPNMIFYAGSDYSPQSKSSIVVSLRASAICATWDWVACMDCQKKDWQSSELQTRYRETAEGFVLVQKNGCKGAQLPQGMLNWVTLLFLMGCLTLVSLYLGAREVRYDEDKLTASDYTVFVKNPPEDALNPDEWKDFFSQFADKQVSCVTIAINNEKLLRNLVIRRIHRNNLRLMLPRGVDLDDEDVVRSAVAQLIQERELNPRGCLWKIFDCTILPILQLFGIMLPAETLVDRIFDLTEQIKEQQKEVYHASRVFVTFETEEGQRAALSALSVGKFDIMMNSTANSAPSAIFKDTVLDVVEPCEASAVRWLDLSSTASTRMLWRFLNFGVTIGLLSISGLLVARVRFKYGAGFSGPLISILNSVIPQVVKILMIFEPHLSEGTFQTSLYLKITLFRWINTALLVQLLTPFTSTVSNSRADVLPQIHSLLWSELWLAPVLRLLDITSNLRKHVLAPRALTQEQMNQNFTGTFYNLGERYTDLTKVLFMCFFYSALYPTAFLFGAAILFVQYFTDKFCLLRIWNNGAAIGSELASFSRQYFFSASVLAFAIISSYAWAQFPYDNLCWASEPKLGAAKKYQNLKYWNGTAAEPIEVVNNEFRFFCKQRWKNFQGLPFPPTSRVQPNGFHWMNKSQKTLTDIYGATAVAVLCFFVVMYFGSVVRVFFVSWFRGVYKPKGQEQHIDFSSTPISAYIPQISRPHWSFPLLACDIDYVDQSLIGWNDPTRSYDYYNLIFDVPWEGMRRQKIIVENTRTTTVIADQDEFRQSSNPPQKSEHAKISPIFSIVKHYPPAWFKEIVDETDEIET